ncbi:MAG TPA: DUF1614 domain-containing protein [Acidiferrobacterales bacterium]
MRSPFSLPQLAILAFVFALLVVLVQIGALRIAFEKLGLAPESAALLFVLSLAGSLFNLPLFTIDADAPAGPRPLPRPFRLLNLEPVPFTGKTLIAVNVGGGAVPVAFSLYLVTHNPVSLWQVLLAVAAVTAICRAISRPVPGLGIGMPVLVAPVAAALVALILSADQAPTLAYVGGTLGVLIGADLLRFGDIRAMGAPVASIGGAGTFDGIFITGLVAVLLA